MQRADFEYSEMELAQINEYIDNIVGLAYSGIYGSNERAKLFAILSECQMLKKIIREGKIVSA